MEFEEKVKEDMERVWKLQEKSGSRMEAEETEKLEGSPGYVQE